MGLLRPSNRDPNGDESVLSPTNGAESLVVSERGTDKTKRLESDSTGNLHTAVTADSTKRGSSATQVTISASTSAVTLLAANSSRKSAVFFSESTGQLYLKFGSGAASSSYTVRLSNGDYFSTDSYTGIITGVWSNTNGSVKVTEIA